MAEQSSKEGQLRVWSIENVPNRPCYFEVKDLTQAQDLIERLANLQLNDPNITSNAFGLEVFRNGEWEEWESCDGLDINEFMGE